MLWATAQSQERSREVTPNLDAGRNLPPILTITGSVLPGSSSLPQIKRPGIAAPLK
jgi:hypothetical protein